MGNSLGKHFKYIIDGVYSYNPYIAMLVQV